MLIKERQSTVEVSQAASGKTEKVSDLDYLLKELIPKRDEMEFERKRQREWLEWRVEQLVAVGRSIR